MKKIIFLICCMLAAATASYSQASQQDIIKERKATMKLSKAELNAKATKAAQKEAKALAKEGWTVSPGALPLEKQLDRSYLMQYEFDEDLFPKYIMSEAQSIGENYDAAKLQALELAKQNLAGQIQTEVTSLIETTVANEQLSAEEANSITQTIAANKNLIVQSIGRTIPVVECYRTLANKNKEVLVRVAYNSEMSKQAAKKAAHQALQDKGDELQTKLDGLMKW